MDARRWKGRGFSIIETLIALLLIGVVVAYGTPFLLSMAQRNRISAQVNDLIADLYLARSAAITRNRDVVLCRSEDGIRCLRSSRSSTTWSMGWIVFEDSDDDPERSPNEPLLKVRTGVGDGLKIRFNQWWRIGYHSDGSAKNGSFTVCDQRDLSPPRAVIVFYSGRPRVSGKSADGGALDCDLP